MRAYLAEEVRRTRPAACSRPCPGRLIVVAPASTAARQTVATNAGSDRVASSHENSTSSTLAHACATEDVAARRPRRASAGASSPCGARWSRGRCGSASAARPRARRRRRRCPSGSRGTARRPWRAPRLVRPPGPPRSRRARRPRSQPRSRPHRAARAARRSPTFSSGRRAIPGACSPSRSVVSKMVILRELNVFLLDSARAAGGPVASDVGVCALQRVVDTPPRGGESGGSGRSTRTGYVAPREGLRPGYETSASATVW